MFSSLNKIVDRIGEIFNVFDFSYIVSGIASLAVISYGLWRYNLLYIFDNDLFNVVFCNYIHLYMRLDFFCDW